jgi:pimeloyl-ACP methyl ester carboxylesterase
LPTITANSVELYYEEIGDSTAPAILLIMGLGTQLIAWPEDFRRDLAASGFRVIAFDNRDIGLSTTLDEAPATNLAWAALASRFGLPWKPPYTLTDMATDAVALLDALKIKSAHIVGASMGGMIAQIIAATAPNRVLSLTSIMSTSGAPGLPGASPAIKRHLLAPRRKRNAIAATADILERTSFPDPARPPGAFHEMAVRAHNRAWNPRARTRHLLAILADGSRADRLASITAPTLVVHGAADPLIPPACGADTAARIASARFEVIEAMAHDLPPSQMPRLAQLIADHATASDKAARAANHALGSNETIGVDIDDHADIAGYRDAA